MALEPGSRRDIASSPLSSGRSSPAPKRRNDDGDIARKDPKYKRYTANIERALALFESHALQEWADYISFLGRLLKALQSYPTFPQIPQRILVSKRLAQCLNPRLPSGVHQKTIEVYSYIFSLIGRDGLANDLTIWTPGLTPVLSYASISVKPHFLSLLETFYLPLGRRLRPALKSLILALLPGIDEEGGEYFDQTMNLLESIRTAVDEDTYFWQCFLLATITSQARRQGALAFLVRKLPKLDSEEELTSPLIRPEPGLLIRCFSAGLGDEQLLVQRGFLDLLVTSLPLSSPILQKLVSPSDMELLITSAASVVLRRDMSLNRRLWVWFLGPDPQDHTAAPSSPHRPDYFNKYALQGLIRGLRNMIESDRMEPAERAKPSRICLSLMDRWEIGGLVVPGLFMPIVRSVCAFEKSAPSKEQYIEVLKSVAVFFDGVESALIWGEIYDTISSALTTSKKTEESLENLRLVSFILKTFNVREEEMLVVHAPLVLLALLLMLQNVGPKESFKLIPTGFGLAVELLALIPERAFLGEILEETLLPSETDVVPILNKYYASPSSKTESIPFSSHLIGRLLLRLVSDLVCHATVPQQADIGIRCKLLVETIKKIPTVVEWDGKPLLDATLQGLQSSEVQFTTLQGSAQVIATLYDRGYLSHGQINSLIPTFVEQIWRFLSPDTPKYHVEAVNSLWAIQAVLNDRRVEAAIAAVLVSDDINGVYEMRPAESGRKFSVLWTHSVGNPKYEMMLTRPLFLFLDSLVEEVTELHIFTRGWLQSLVATNKLFNIFVIKLLGFKFLRDPGSRDTNGAPLKRRTFSVEDDLDICSYYLQTLSNILRYSTDVTLASLAKEKVVAADEHERSSLHSRGFDEETILQDILVSILIWVIDGEGVEEINHAVSKLHRIALSVLHQLLLSPHSDSLATMQLENILVARLISTLNTRDTYVQVSLLDVLYAAFKLSLVRSGSQLSNLRPSSSEITIKTPRISITASDAEKAVSLASQPTPPAQLVRCLIGGFSSQSSRPVLDSWVNFLAESLPLLSEVIFQILISLVECFCAQIKNNFEILKVLYTTEAAGLTASSEYTLVSLLNGLEQILAAAHDKLMVEEVKNLHPKSPNEPAGFFGNMVSGVFATETPQSRSAAANNRLTVLLCFQDTVRICYTIWSWGDVYTNKGLDDTSSASFRYTSMKLRARSRRILEHMFAAETLECLETLIELWLRRGKVEQSPYASIFRLINVLDGSRPKFTVPAIFNAIYSRTNPSALDPSRKSTLTSELTDIDVVRFLVEYAHSLEDDAMDEIWTDCIMFLKDVLANPFPHRQSLPSLLQFTALLAEKVDNTNFGEQKKMRKELGDLFLRLLAAAFTVRPVNPQELAPTPTERESDGEKLYGPSQGKPDSIVDILVTIVPQLRKVLVEPDRVLAAVTTISTSVIGPVFRSKAFPQNISASILELLRQLTKIPNSQKAWKKDLSDAFSDPKFFAFPVPLVKNNWIPLLRQWIQSDRDRLTDLLTKITPPTTAGVIFGVGASSTRNEADRKAQLNLRRIACLVFAAENDAFVVNLKELEDTIVALLDATPVTSPSSVTRADIYLVLRALLLRVSPVHLSSFWPLINTELQASISSLLPEEDSDIYTEFSLLQACKLLDALLTIAPDEFQLHEWLFITDTIEAIYRPSNWVPTALADQVASFSTSIAETSSTASSLPLTSALRNQSNASTPSNINGTSLASPARRPWLSQDSILDIEKAAVAASLAGAAPPPGVAGQITARVLRPFFTNLSLFVYESTYKMGGADVAVCEEMLLADLFDDVGSGVIGMGSRVGTGSSVAVGGGGGMSISASGSGGGGGGVSVGGGDRS